MSLDLPGFADPVFGAQAAFRAILAAMSRPGSIHSVGAGLAPPFPLNPSAAAVLLSLVDADTTLHLGAELESGHDWLAFHCGAKMADSIGAADFVMALEMPDLTTLANGSDEGPEESATLILQVSAFGEGEALHLSGPGLRVPEVLKVAGLPDTFVTAWAANHFLFPRGVDIVLCAGDQIVALPRSLHITREG